MPNRLALETSPYLQQHADNPVDWHPWGERALRLAREQDRPILLSIGYSACHWCHVMARESFEDAETAELMNAHYVNIKVDREERPDLDQIYQTAHQLLTRRGGGWPLTMFLTPDGTPFFGGTYFPRTPRNGMAGFRDLLPRIAAAYREQRGEIARQNAALLEALEHTLPDAPDRGALRRDPVDAVVRDLAGAFDAEHGGLGQAPKFPHPHELAYCLRRHVLDADATAAGIVQLTLTRMAEGGIYDQLGGGFYRYSVDRHWSIPHFEKMLCDNGPLLALYSDAWRVTGEPRYREVAAGIASWVMREMQSPEGGYYAALDADSEHEEGRFYVWTPDEARALLTADEYAVVAPHYGLEGAPNFEGRLWHLRVTHPSGALAQRLGMPPDACAALLAQARAKLLAARDARVRPGRDEKVLTSWNALMIRGMARGARLLSEPAWLDSARRATDFIRRALWSDGRLRATYKDGRAQLNAYLDDHAFLLDALLELMQTDFRREDLALACSIAELILERFEDRAQGGFFFTSDDHEQLIHRAKPGHDSATPSGNGVAAWALQRLGHLAGESRYLEAAEHALRIHYPALARQPGAFVSLATALEEALNPPQVVILRGPAAELAQWQRTLAARCRPATLVLALPPSVRGLPASLDKPVGGSVSAWLCHGTACLPPIADAAALDAALEAHAAG